MVTLANLNGGSLALDLNAAFSPHIERAREERKVEERENKDIDLLRTAQGLPGIFPQGDKKSEGFLRKIAPGLADQLDKLNKDRNPDQVDELRKEATINVETAARIRRAKTPAEKQRIILERAGEFQKQGRDNRELLKMSGMTPAEMDLQAQKAQMTGEATLKSLPAPTDSERLAARAQLAVRNPQAFNTLMREEAVERQIAAQKAAQARAGAARSASAAQAAQKAQILSQLRTAAGGQPAAAGDSSSPQAEPQTVGGVPLEFGKLDVGNASGFDPIIDSARAQQAEITDPTTAALAGQVVTGLEGQRQAAQDVGLQAARQAAGVSDIDPGLSFGNLAQPETPQAAAPEPVGLVSQADAVFRQAQAATDRAIAQRDSISDPTVRKLADDVVKEFEAAEKAALADRDAEIEFAKDTAPAADGDASATQEKIRLLMEADPKLPEALATNAVVRFDLRTNPVTGETTLVDKVTGQVVGDQAAQPANEAQAPTPPPPEDGGFGAANDSFGAEGWGKGIANSIADVAGAPLPFPDVAQTQQSFRVLSENLTNQMAETYSGRVPAFLLTAIKDLTPRPGRITEGASEAKNKLGALGNSLARARFDLEQELFSRNDISPTERRALLTRKAAINSAISETDIALGGFDINATSADADDEALMQQLLEGN